MYRKSLICDTVISITPKKRIVMRMQPQLYIKIFKSNTKFLDFTSRVMIYWGQHRNRNGLCRKEKIYEFRK